MVKQARVQIPVAGFSAALAFFFLGACSSLPRPLLFAHPQISAAPESASDDDEIDLETTLKGDLARSSMRTSQLGPVAPERRVATSTEAPPRQRIVLQLPLNSLPMPVVGVRPGDLEDNFGESRDGGRRKHRGLDIFAPRGSEIVAVTDGVVSYIGEQPKGGRCLWLVDEHGMSFYYAHLDRWSAGLYEGEEVHIGDILGFVGTTGNAVGTSPHLHFQVARDDEPIDPYPLLRADGRSLEPRRAAILEGGFGTGGSK
jgi:murein DD-endopeptidase MepM/ murein hydrolase activator NlpD